MPIQYNTAQGSEGAALYAFRHVEWRITSRECIVCLPVSLLCSLVQHLELYWWNHECCDLQLPGHR